MKSSHPGFSRSFLLFLVLTALAGGTLTMVIEILGARIIGPFFGVSIFVWTSVISVTMISLALGYALGGMFSDRQNHPDFLYFFILLAGVFVLMVPFTKGPALNFFITFGLRSGAFFSSLVLFGPPLLLLGCVSPYVVKLAARELSNIGRTVGVFYAISTIGSVFGTLLAGFVLVSYLGVDKIFYLVGMLLILLSVTYYVCFRRTIISILLLLIPIPFFPSDTLITKVLDDGTTVSLLAKKEGYYGNVKVVDYKKGAVHTREMIIDGLLQGGIVMNNGLSINMYPYILGFFPRYIQPSGKKCLVIGLGAGIIPALYEKDNIEVDVVDIDPNVYQLAKEYFNYNGSVYIEDARYFLMTTDNKYDYIILDVFNGDTTPSHLLSREAFTLMKKCLSKDGVLGLNIFGSLRDNNFMTVSTVRTIENVFDHVQMYPNFNPSSGDGTGNISLFAYDGKKLGPSFKSIQSLEFNNVVRRNLETIFKWKYSFSEKEPFIILTDDFNPLDCFDLFLKEKVRKNILNATDWDILNG